jgi:LysR family transcriptional regulator, glycine cleavage system transcriptional activator
MPRTPSLDALRIFAVAAKHLSFTLAASQLNLTQSAVSHRIRALEEELGFDLFRRLTRRLELTARGQSLAREVEQAISTIDACVADLAGNDDRAPLKVTVLPSVAAYWLLPCLARVRAQSPDIHVQVIADPRPLDLRTNGIDLAIRFSRTPNPAYVATPLMSDCVVPVCSPDLLHRHRIVEGIDDLLAMPLLHDSATEADGSGSDWRAWLDHVGRSDATCDAGQRFSEASMLINAAMLGLGVAMARMSLVVDQLAQGSLVCPLRKAAPTAYSYHLLRLPEAADRPKVNAFSRLLIEQAAATEAHMRCFKTHRSHGASMLPMVAIEA